MGRGVSSGGGESSLGYLFRMDQAPKSSANRAQAVEDKGLVPKSSAAPDVDISLLVPAGIQEKKSNNYFRAAGQNSGNFLTDRTSTKVQAAPGGGSSLGYLFGGAAAGAN